MLSEFKNEAESLPSQENMNNSKSVNEFIDTTKKQLDTKVKNKYRIDSGRYDFEKVMLQDMIAQEIGEFIEVDTR
jgi:hypothetical protein